jgi:phosphoenolpyruvate carboxykinase (GTP)
VCKNSAKKTINKTRKDKGMLELKKGIDILSEIGGVKTLTEAKALFEERCDKDNLTKLKKIKNTEALLKIANAISMIGADSVFVHTGSNTDIKKVREMSMKMGAERPLAMKGHTIHFDLPEEQGRVVDKTLYIVNEDEDVSSLARKISREDAFEHVKQHMKDIGKGKTLLVGFFSRGPIGAKASIPALEMTTSPYVMHSADILYRHVYGRFDEECKRRGLFFTNVHSEGLNRLEDLPNARVLMDRSWLTTFSILFTYAGNTLLLKKGNHRFAVDLAVYFGREAELSEHMFITGMRGKGGRKTYFAGAAPSGCGKTTTAMVGSDFIGDDLAQLWIADDGTLRGVNPECGIFGIVQDVNLEGDPYLMKVMRGEGYEVIWSNVLIDEKDEPHWVGDGDPISQKGVNYMGEWHPGKLDASGKPVPMSHPNSRCTLASRTIENYNETDAEDPRGAEIKVITYSGRDADTMPPVYVAKTVDQGVIIGASVLSEATATEVGVKGVRPQPWANEPFIPGPLGEYMDAQFAFFNSAKLTQKPIMAGLNYFLTYGSRGGEGNKLLGEKRDVKVWLGWLEQRANGDADAIETPIGFIPKYEDLKNLFAGIGKEYPKALYDKQFSFYVENIITRIDVLVASYKKEKSIPPKAFEVYNEQRIGLEALKAKYGPIVSVEQLAEGK